MTVSLSDIDSTISIWRKQGLSPCDALMALAEIDATWETVAAYMRRTIIVQLTELKRAA